MSQVWLMRPVIPVPEPPPRTAMGVAGVLAHVLLGQDLDEVDHGVGALDLDHLGAQEEAPQERQGRQGDDGDLFHVLSPFCRFLSDAPQKDRKNVRLNRTSLFFVALEL